MAVQERSGTPPLVRPFVPAPIPAVPARRRPPVRDLVQILTDMNGAAFKSPIASGTTAGKASALLRSVREFLFREKYAWIRLPLRFTPGVPSFQPKLRRHVA